MPKPQSRKKKSPKRVLALPDLEHAKAAVAPKTLLVLPDADHNDDALLAGDEMIRAIVRFLQPLR